MDIAKVPYTMLRIPMTLSAAVGRLYTYQISSKIANRKSKNNTRTHAQNKQIHNHDTITVRVTRALY